LRAIRVGLGGGGREGAGVTVPQYRTLFYVSEHEGASLSELAEFMGLTLPSASKLVDHLVRRAILLREPDNVDRRRLTLRISRKGDALFNNAQEKVRQHLAGMLDKCDADALKALGRALGILQESFPPLGGDFQKARGEGGALSRKSVFRRTSAP
jgi:DNA-binding MarR family transcriptional regulator